MDSAISIHDIKKTYKGKKQSVEALKGFSFNIQKGEFFGLLGPNGAGKSTLINIISGLTEKTGGSISVLGLDIDSQHIEVKKRIGVVPQEITFDPFFTVEKAIEFQFGYFDKPYDPKRAREILEQLSLWDKRDVKPRKLSGGMKRRFMIAKAMVHDPEVLILDEPTAGVDVELRHDLYDIVRKLNKQGKTIILTSHYLEEVELLCQRVAIINNGDLVAIDDKESLKDRFESKRIFSISLTKKLVAIPDSLKKYQPEQVGGELKLSFDESDYASILKDVGEADLDIAHFKIIEPSLEDVFVSLTKK